MNGPVLAAEGIEFRLGGLRILNGIDFSLAAGEICGIVGPNGSGKTTFLNALSGFIAPQAGLVFFEGRDITREAAFERARMGIGRSFQLVRVVESATASENVAAGLYGRTSGLQTLWRKRNGGARVAAVERALQRVAVAEFGGWPVRYLSFGTRRKIELARVIVSEPRALLADEPTAGVSRAHILAIEKVLREEAERGCGVVIVDHDLEFVSRIATRVVVLDGGNIIFEGSAAQAWRDESVVEAYLGH